MLFEIIMVLKLHAVGHKLKSDTAVVLRGSFVFVCDTAWVTLAAICMWKQVCIFASVTSLEVISKNWDEWSKRGSVVRVQHIFVHHFQRLFMLWRTLCSYGSSDHMMLCVYLCPNLCECGWCFTLSGNYYWSTRLRKHVFWVTEWNQLTLKV